MEELIEPTTLEYRELTVVMPVHNEEANLKVSTTSWLKTLDTLKIDYRLLILNDGSTDSTEAVLSQLDRYTRVMSVSKLNEGHGPTILRGYRLGVLTSDWVFQVDSDDEIPAARFPTFWAARDGVDAVFGIRTGRQQTPGRQFVSRLAASTNRVLLKGNCEDPNVPFRLIRSSALAPIIDKIPIRTFAPNVIIAGALSRDPSTFTEVSVPHSERAAGQTSIIGFSLAKAAVRSFFQIARIARHLQ